MRISDWSSDVCSSDLFGQRRRIGDRERHVEQARQCFGEQRLAGTGRADQQNVRLGDLDAFTALQRQTLVVVVDGDRQNLLGGVLADDVLVQRRTDLVRRWEEGRVGEACGGTWRYR